MEPRSVPAHRGAMPWRGLLLTASLLTFWSQPTTAQQDFTIPIEFMPPNAVKGKEVLLLAQKLPETFARLDWCRGDFQPDSNIASLRKNPENTTKGPAHSGRETLYSNGTLLIQNLTLEDTNTYYIQVLTVNFEYKYGKRELCVYDLCEFHEHCMSDLYEGTQNHGPSDRSDLSTEARVPQNTTEFDPKTSKPLAKPNIMANNSSPIEQEDSVVLMCESESPGTTYRWFINTRPIQPSTMLQLSLYNRTLTVLHVTRKDTGPYECETSNPVSVNRSNPFILTVLYGPDTLAISPSKSYYHRGENLSLSCLTASNPPANFSWFMGEKLLGSTQTLSVPNLSLNNSGSYSCLVSNQATRLNRTASINVTVFDPVVSPSIRASNTTVTEGAGPVVLTCLTNDNDVSIQWYLNDTDLQPAERRKLSADNKTLTLQPVLMVDGGDYQCEVSNPISFNRSDHIKLQVATEGGTFPVGIIVGTVFGVLVRIGLVAALSYFLFRRRSKRNQGHHDHIEQKPPMNPPGPGATSSSTAQVPLPDQSPVIHIYETLLTPDSSLYCRVPPKAYAAP